MHRDLIFGAFEPDMNGQPASGDLIYLTDAENVRATSFGYKLEPSFATVTGGGTLPSIIQTTVIGGFAVSDGGSASQDHYVVGRTGGSFQIAFTDNDGSTFTDVTPSSPPAVDDSSRFSYAVYDQLLYMTPRVNSGLYSKTVNSSTAFSLVSGAPTFFEDMAVVRDHLVLTRATDNYDVQWCAITDPTDWPTPGTTDALSKQAGKQTIPTQLGQPRVIVGGEKFGLIFCEGGIVRMTYIGGNVVYQFDTIDEQYGLGPGRSAAQRKPVKVNNVFYWANSGGAFMTDGYTVKEITGSIKETFFLAKPSDGWSSYPDVWSSWETCVFERERNLVRFVNTADPDLLYNINLGQWTTQSSDYSLQWGGTSDVALYSQTGAVWALKDRTTPLLTTSDYTDVTVTLQTGFIELAPSQHVLVTGIHLIGSNDDGSLTFSYKATDSPLSLDISQTGFTNFTSPNRGEIYTARAHGRYFAFRVTGAIDATATLAGLRVFYQISDTT